ncbi:MAG: hypothetical protein ACHP7M_11805 [Burkholderiales bacterium]
MKRLLSLALVALACGCTTELKPPDLTPAEVCDQVCQKLSSCPDRPPGDYQACVTGFRCAMQTDQQTADCEEACLSKPSCSVEYEGCRDQCIEHDDLCAPSCGTCASDQVCFGGTIGNTSDISFSATCRKRCGSDDDCASGEKCVEEYSTPGELTGPVCLPAGLTRCDQSIVGACRQPSTCLDANTLQQVYFDNQSVCGLELVHCPNGCEGPSADGGVSDGGVAGHCR